MEWLIENWLLILIPLLVLGGGIFYVIKFLQLPSEKQTDQIKAWLLWAVTEAERDLGSGTGKLKLSLVYGMFVSKFSWIAKVLSFAVFSGFVDDALEEMREILEKNPAASNVVNGANQCS